MGCRRPISLMRTHTVTRAIGVSQTACKDGFRRNLRSHSWSVFSFLKYYTRLNGYSSCTPGMIFHAVQPVYHVIRNAQKNTSSREEFPSGFFSQILRAHTTKTVHLHNRKECSRRDISVHHASLGVCALPSRQELQLRKSSQGVAFVTLRCYPGKYPYHTANPIAGKAHRIICDRHSYRVTGALGIM